MTDFLFGWLHTPMIERTAADEIVMCLEIMLPFAVYCSVRYGIVPAVRDRKRKKK